MTEQSPQPGSAKGVPLAGERVGFVFDFASLASLLAFQPTCALADEANVAVDWLPFSSPPRPAVRGDTAGARHRRVRTAYFAADNARYARWQGISVRRDSAGVDAALVHAGCLWANRCDAGRAFLERTWPAFWANELDIETPEVVAEALAAVGAAGFDEAVAHGMLREHGARLAEQGVFTAPSYLLGDELFLGRAHLPLIRTLLSTHERA